MFVKICGLTDRAAVDAAVEAGADAIGFVFAESVREVTTEQAVELCRELPTAILRIAVMRRPGAARVAAVLREFAPDWIQSDAGDFADFAVPAPTRCLPVYRDGETEDLSELPPRLLYEGRVSGSGKTADWNEARRLAGRTELILAGGLDAGNVERAIEAVQPFGVDVSSGVEYARGRKDPRRIREFVARVRALEN